MKCDVVGPSSSRPGRGLGPLAAALAAWAFTGCFAVGYRGLPAGTGGGGPAFGFHYTGAMYDPRQTVMPEFGVLASSRELDASGAGAQPGALALVEPFAGVLVPWRNVDRNVEGDESGSRRSIAYFGFGVSGGLVTYQPPGDLEAREDAAWLGYVRWGVMSVSRPEYAFLSGVLGLDVRYAFGEPVTIVGSRRRLDGLAVTLVFSTVY